MKLFFSYCARNLQNWSFTAVKLFLVSTISYFFLKLLEGVWFMDQIFSQNERFFLTAYVGLQFISGLVFFELIGLLVERQVRRWIKDNEEKLTIEVTKHDKKELKKIFYFVFRVMIYLKIISREDMRLLGTGIKIGDDVRLRDETWEKVLLYFKNFLGIFLLSIVTGMIMWKVNMLFVLLLIILISLAVVAFFILAFYYFLIKNMHLIEAVIRSYDVSLRTIQIKSVGSKEMS